MTLVLDPTDQPFEPTDRSLAPEADERVDGDAGIAVIEAGQHPSLHDDIAEAVRVVAPLWPLERFIAVNPWQGLTGLGFGDAVATTRRWLGTHGLPGVAVARRAVADGRLDPSALARALERTMPELAQRPPLSAGRRAVAPAALVVADLLAGDAVGDLAGVAPVAPSGPEAPRTVVEAELGRRRAAAVDGEVGRWLVTLLDVHHGPAAALGSSSVWDAWRVLARRDRRLRGLVGHAGMRWLRQLPEDPVDAVADALEVLGVADDARADELRGQCSRLPGWAGYARWCDEWAAPDDPAPRLGCIDLLAVRLACDAALRLGAGAADAPGVPVRPEGVESDRAPRALAAVGLDGADPVLVAQTDALLASCDPVRIGEAVLAALEEQVAGELMRAVRLGAPADGRPPAQAQIVCCIDVRAEGLRRELEGLGPYETIGFAGFFAMPVRFAGAGAVESVPSAPALLTPTVEVREAVGASEVARRRATAEARDTLAAASHEPAAMFALAEAAGWVLGPAALCRTLLPDVAASAPGLAGHDVSSAPVAVAGDGVVGFTLDERVAMAEGALRTMGLVDGFAPVVVLCGHGATTAANAHGASLDCGACGGNRGGANARVAAAVLEDPAVREALAGRGIVIPDHTWFVPAEHDTTTDEVRLLVDDVPVPYAATVAELERDLAEAGRRLAARRLAALADDASDERALRRVRRRAADWAQVRPEWGLAGNAAFIVGPRDATIDADLGGRAFLHSYDVAGDVDGAALETILTAPMVVAHWINLQYYGSTVDPGVHGAGDKTLHNPVGGVGVLEGLGVDLRPGLPWQSVADARGPRHEPVRLHTVVVAPVERVERVIAKHPILGELFDGAWVHLSVLDPDRGWRRRRPGGDWDEVRP